jgi:hypothetical protein
MNTKLRELISKFAALIRILGGRKQIRYESEFR